MDPALTPPPPPPLPHQSWGGPGQPYQQPERRPGTITAVAIVSIVLGLVCGCGALFSTASSQIMAGQGKMFESIQTQAAATQDAEITQLRAHRAAATTPEQQAAFDAQIAAAEARQSIRMPDMTGMFKMMESPEIQRPTRIFGIVGSLLNLALLVSGIGLFSLARWARTLNITASIGCILAKIAETIWTVTVVLPKYTEFMGGFMKGATTAQTATGGPSIDMSSMMGMMSGMQSAMAVLMCLLICGWFVAAIIMLRSRAATAAFQAA